MGCHVEICEEHLVHGVQYLPVGCISIGLARHYVNVTAACWLYLGAGNAVLLRCGPYSSNGRVRLGAKVLPVHVDVEGVPFADKAV